MFNTSEINKQEIKSEYIQSNFPFHPIIQKTKKILEKLFKNNYSIFHPETLKNLNKISPQRILNLIHSAIAQKFGLFLSEIHPTELYLEVVRGCNFKCIMCDSWKFPKYFLSLDDVKKILPHFSKSIFLQSYGVGEPFLNKDIYKIVRYASEELKFITSISSNFSVISPQKALDMGANEIMASIDSIDPEKFLRLRGISLDIVIKNLKTILSLKPKNKEFPIIAIRTIISNENIEELQDIVEFGLSMGVKKFYFQDSADGYLLRKLSKLSKEEISKVFLVRDKFKDKAKIYIYLWDSKAEGFTPTGYCFNAFFIGTIGYDGELYTCCRYFGYKEASLGNVLKDPQKALKNRLIFLKRFRSNPPDFCKNCETYCRMCSKNGKA